MPTRIAVGISRSSRAGRTSRGARTPQSTTRATSPDPAAAQAGTPATAARVMATATALPPTTSTRSCCGSPRGTAYRPLIDRRCRRVSTGQHDAEHDHLRQPEVGDEGAGMLPAALDGQQVGEVGDRQQQARRVGQPHGREGERQRRQVELRGHGQRDRRQHHRRGVDAEGDRRDGGQGAVEREQDRGASTARAGDEVGGDVEDLRVRAQVADEGDQQEEGEDRPGGGPRRDHGVDKHAATLAFGPCPPRSTAPAPPSRPPSP